MAGLLSRVPADRRELPGRTREGERSSQEILIYLGVHVRACMRAYVCLYLDLGSPLMVVLRLKGAR